MVISALVQQAREPQDRGIEYGKRHGIGLCVFSSPLIIILSATSILICSYPSVQVEVLTVTLLPRSGFLVRFEMFMAVMVQVQFFWGSTQCNVVVGNQHLGDPCCCEDGGNMDLRKVGILP
jgi:hypothetical protein